MIYKQGGLAHFQAGGSSDSGLSQSVPVKVSAGKSAIAPAGNVNLNPEQIGGLLENMRRLEAERSSPMNTFLEGLQEASVWGSGKDEGPGANLIALRRQKALEREERLAQMERMNALEAAQQKAGSDAAFVNRLLGGGGGGELPGTVSTAGGAPSMSPTTAFTDQTIPRQVRERMLAAGNATAAKAVYDEWLKGEIEKSTAFKYSADMRAPVEVMVNGEPVQMTRLQFAQYAEQDPVIGAALRKENPQLAAQVLPRPGGAPGVSRPGTAVPTAAPGAGAPSMVVPAAPGVGGRSKTSYEENVKLQSGRLSQANEAFIKTQYTPLAETVEAQKNDIYLAQNVLSAIQTGNYGPGSGIRQAVMQASQALGIPQTEKAAEQYLNNLTIEQAKRLFVASGARAAMGAQFTQVESERFEKTLAGITDPVEYIKNVYQMKIALAKISQERLDFLDANPQNMAEANRLWKKSGRAEQILMENVDYLRDRAAKEKDKGKGGTPQKTVARTGKITNKNNPNFGKTVIEYSDGTMEIK